MFRVARNRMTDLFRRRARREEPFERALDDEAPVLEEWLPSREAGPEAAWSSWLCGTA
jgi:DNA-directed RNA polymerase specialized sigma24 family protein